MSDNRPIGIFDSGLGGLTVAKEIFNVLPHESVVYIGDTARVPYGNRSPETITRFSRQLVNFLIKQDVKAIIVACATASSVALKQLQQEFPQIPIYGVIYPTVKSALSTTKNGRIGIIGTLATINSRSFENTIELITRNHDYTSKNNQIKAILNQSSACPLFVPIIEEGILSGEILKSTIHLYLNSIKHNDIDTLILGCTHYPLISQAIQSYLPKTALINPGEAIAKMLSQELTKNKLLAKKNNSPTRDFYATNITENFIRISNLFLESTTNFQYQQIED